MKRRAFLKLGTGAAVSGTLAACGGSGSNPASAPVSQAQASQDRTVSGWAQIALQAVRTVKPGPPMAARSFAIMFTCMYNAWCAYDPVAQPTRIGAGARQSPADRTPVNKAAAMSYAAYAALVDQYPSEKAAFDAYMNTLRYDPASAGTGTPAGLGTSLARAELDYCHVDGANQLGDLAPGGVAYADYTGYVTKNPPMIVGAPTPLQSIPAPGNWQPLTFADATGVVRTPSYAGAAWERVKPFALSSSDEYRPGPPAAFGSSEYVDQAKHVVEVQAALTDEQKVIAEYWADGPNSELPPGHWLLFGLQISVRDGHSDDDDIKMFFALSNALADAAIAAWDAKRAYDSERPITAIRYLMNGQTITGYGVLGPAGGLRSIPGETWVPYQKTTSPTPAFPEHVSGHSTFSAAAAEVLKSFTGSDMLGTSYTKSAGSLVTEPGIPSADVTLRWATFTAAAEQAGISRIYGGIHFDNANAAGLTLGRQVGTRAFAKAQGLWQGKA
jgi:hypothetical protein